MIQTHAPNRLAKLEFKRLESELRSELKRAEDELDEERSGLESNIDSDELLNRHDRLFRDGEVVSRCDGYLSELRACLNELVGCDGKKSNDDRHLQEICSSLENWLGKVRKSAAEMAARLRMLPQTWAFVESTFGSIDSWLSEISRHSLGIFDSHLGSAIEYKRCIDRLMVKR